VNSKTVLGIVGVTIAIGAAWMVIDSRDSGPADITGQLVELMEQGDEAGATRLLEESAERNMNGAIDVRGVVRDEDGKPLSGVTISFQETHLAANPANASIETDDITVDGEFELECGDCSAIEADFTKGGYHTVAHEWIAFGPNRKQPGMADDDVVVVMQARGIPASLEPFRGILQAGTKTRVLPFSFGMGSGVMSPDRLDERAADENVANPLYLRLAVDTDADGSVLVEQVSRAGSETTFGRARNARLDFSTANGGAIPYMPKERNVRLIDREMSRAPTSGYKEYLDIVRTDGTPQYFYCRIGDRYGRGIVDPVRLSRSDPVGPGVEVSVSIKLNAVPGDANLTPRH